MTRLTAAQNQRQYDPFTELVPRSGIGVKLTPRHYAYPYPHVDGVIPMTPVSRLIWRNAERLHADQPLLLVDPPPDDLAGRLSRAGLDVSAYCQEWSSFVRLERAGIRASFGAIPEFSRAWPQLILFQPREKARLEMMLEVCASLLERDGRLWLVGENRAGIKSAGRRLGPFFDHSANIDNARHCSHFEARAPQRHRPFSLRDHVTAWPLPAADRELRILSLPGVFAHGRLDPGTALLLEALTREPTAAELSGRLLDFACGAGVIGLSLLAGNPDLEVTLLDDSALALESARFSLAANALEADIIPSDGLTELLKPPGTPRFDWIVSNPPFHAGVREDPGIAKRFFAGCRRLLAPGGPLVLVANVHRPCRGPLEELFDGVQVIAADRRYNVWLAR